MSNSYSNLFIHMVFATKYRDQKIDSSIEKRVHEILKQELEKMGCVVLAINGMPDHIHILFSSKMDLSQSDIAKQIKGASSYWINKEKLTQERFSWQRGFAAFSVSNHQIGTILRYIKNQKVHHSPTQEIETEYWKKIVLKAS